MSLFKFKTKPGLTLWPDLACARDIIYIMIYTTNIQSRELKNSNRANLLFKLLF